MRTNVANPSSPEPALSVEGYKVLAGAVGRKSRRADWWARTGADLVGFLEMHEALLSSEDLEETDNRFEQTWNVIRLDESIKRFLKESFDKVHHDCDGRAAEADSEVQRWVVACRVPPKEGFIAPQTKDQFVDTCLADITLGVNPGCYFRLYTALVKLGFPPFQARVDEVIQRMWAFNLNYYGWCFRKLPPRRIQILKTRLVASSCGPETVAKDYFKKVVADDQRNRRLAAEARENAARRKNEWAGFYRFVRFAAVLGAVVARGPFEPHTTLAMLGGALSV
ncbi:hypothetical protein KFL_007860050 [Klebsormidium nitens]|uniref:Uncharacterized protein n=1 Tax=Klebsormidium nitens TaxID=105231 RepID=A0A1Y1ILA1_KLENI|nr:hypothetical protein KFL_007860050 [Klebsormidium nitens]|eukprot:GAQ91443.1 hypothetical protein KFL_007860050 [Klebsormidium nitens]